MKNFVTYTAGGFASYGQAETVPEGSKEVPSEQEAEALVNEHNDKLADAQIAEDAERLAELDKLDAEALAKQPKYFLYDRMTLWAAEGGAVETGSADMSFGNGETGALGLVIPPGYELESMAIMASTFPAEGVYTAEFVRYESSNVAEGVAVASVTIDGASDGGGGVNHAFKLNEDVGSPLGNTEAAVFGFRNGKVSGKISNVRLQVTLRKAVAEITAGTVTYLESKAETPKVNSSGEGKALGRS